MQMLTIVLMTALIMVLGPLVIYLGHLWLFARPRPRVPSSEDAEGA